MKNFIRHPAWFFIFILSTITVVFVKINRSLIFEHSKSFYDKVKVTTVPGTDGDKIKGYINEIDNSTLPLPYLKNEEIFIPMEFLHILVCDSSYSNQSCGVFVKRGWKDNELVDIFWAGGKVSDTDDCVTKPQTPPDQSQPMMYFIVSGGRNCGCLPCCGQ